MQDVEFTLGDGDGRALLADFLVPWLKLLLLGCNLIREAPCLFLETVTDLIKLLFFAFEICLQLRDFTVEPL